MRGSLSQAQLQFSERRLKRSCSAKNPQRPFSRKLLSAPQRDWSKTRTFMRARNTAAMYVGFWPGGHAQKQRHGPQTSRQEPDDDEQTTRSYPNQRPRIPRRGRATQTVGGFYS